jgi:hypothetical protein
MKAFTQLVAGYRSALPAPHWAAIEPFVRTIVRTHAPNRNDEFLRVALITLTGFADWVYSTGAAELDSSSTLRPSLIDLYEQYRLTEVQPNIAARDRKRLYALADIPVPAERDRTHSTTSAVTDPYTAADVSAIRDWAHWQPNPISRISANGLVGLGLGCGLSRAELIRVHRKHIHRAGSTVTVDVTGTRARRVTVDLEWAEHLEYAAKSTTGYLIAPGATSRTSANYSSWFARARGNAPVPTRMRTTWLLARIEEATSADELLKLSGLTTIRSLERLLSAHAPHRLVLTHGARSTR